MPTTSALVVRDGNLNRKPKCVYCKAEHYSASCETVNTVPPRIEILKKGGRCFICLARGHRTTQCNANAAESVGKSIISHYAIRILILNKLVQILKRAVIKIQQKKQSPSSVADCPDIRLHSS